MRAPLGLLLEALGMNRRVALRILENELLTIERRLQVYQSLRDARQK